MDKKQKTVSEICPVSATVEGLTKDITRTIVTAVSAQFQSVSNISGVMAVGIKQVAAIETKLVRFLPMQSKFPAGNQSLKWR